MTTTKPKDGDLQVWHIPQVPSQPFTVPVETPQQGWLIMNILWNYDIFQFENNIKPDYCNATGLNVFEDGEWCEWYDEATGLEIGDFMTGIVAV